MSADIKALRKHVHTRVKHGRNQLRCAQRYKDAAQVLDVVERARMEKKANLKTLEEIKTAIEEDVQCLNEIAKKQDIEKIRLKQQYARLTKKLSYQENFLKSEDSCVTEPDLDLYKKQILSEVLKEATGLCEFDASQSTSIRGFTYNSYNVVTPFDINTRGCSASEITEQMYDLMKSTSPYIDEWESLFSNAED